MHPFDLDFFCRLNFQHSCLVFFTLQCVRLFAMSLSYNIIQTGESTKKLGSPLKWRFVFWQKRFAVVAGPSIEQLDITIAIHFFPSPLSPIMISPPRLFNEFGVNSLFFATSFQVGLPGFDSMPSALHMLTKHERASYCNQYWESQFKKVCFCRLDVVQFFLILS